MKDSSSINESSSGDSQRLWLRWAMTNFVGFIIAWGIHSPLAHGLTGDHDDYLTLSQFIAHTIGLFEVGAVIALFQKRVFRRIAPVTDRMVWTTIAFMPVMFWIGYYKAGVPYDLLLAFATIGFIGGMTLRPHLERGNLWLLANTLGFGAGLGVTAMATYPIADELMGAMDGGLIGHTITFLYIGAVSGASSGALTGLALLKLRAGETP